MSRPTHRLLFLGAGTQSSTVLLLACGGRLPHPTRRSSPTPGGNRPPSARHSGAVGNDAGPADVSAGPAAEQQPWVV